MTAWQPGDFAALVHGHLVHHVHTATEILFRSTRDILEAEIPTQQVHSGPCTRVHRVRLYVRVSRELNQSTCPTRVPYHGAQTLEKCVHNSFKVTCQDQGLDWVGMGAWLRRKVLLRPSGIKSLSENEIDTKAKEIEPRL